MIDVNTPLTVTLPAGAFNVIIQALHQLPYHAAAPVVDELRRQIVAIHPHAFDPAVQTPAPAPAPAMPPRVNGLDA